ncbi:MAG: hypothetical protein NVSMB17_15430 [Candidatus Dormibacteria bacterium]
MFVLPAASRVMQSSLNARLLMQYSNSLGKRTSVVSPDPRTQGIAIDTGFNTYPSMAAFEAGRALDRAVEARTADAPLAASPRSLGAAQPPPAAATRRVASVPGPVVAPRPRPLAAQAVAAPVAAVPAGPRRRLGIFPFVLAALGIFLVASILVLFVLPSATVTVTVAARPVTVAPTITGATQPPGPTDRLSVQTALQSDQEQQQQSVQSTGQKVIPGVNASGTVSVGNNGSTPLCCVFQKGNTIEVSTADGKKFSFTPASDVYVPPGGKQDFPITARAPGVASNVAAHSITQMTNNPGSVIVDNAAPTAGGVDAQNKTVVAVADLERVKQQLGAGLSQKVKDALKAKAGKDTVLADTEVIDLAVTADHQPGDEVPNFNATVTAKGHTTTVSEDRIRQLLRDALLRTVIDGYHLTDDPAKLDFKEVQHDDNGGVVWDGSASGFQATAVNEADLRQKVSGKSPKVAAEYVKSHIDALSTSVTLNPPFVPWLPFIASNIHFRTQVQNTAPG